jgi:tRNA U34 5-methylaminomethyl-2-thiouridine-forming methyltransferase MnmC
MIPNIVQTEDGSITCLDANSGELYHNRIGAYTEALAHYVQICDLPALLAQQSSITVLDVCFGLGYNSFVLIDQLLQYIENSRSIKSPISCRIVGIDQDRNILDLIPQVLSDSRFKSLCQALNIDTKKAKEIVSLWQTKGKCLFNLKNKTEISISFEMIIEDLRQAIPRLAKTGEQFDYIFHDGFSPRAMPELWTADLFAQYTKLISNNGRIITYSSAYAVRGAFIECGLEIRKSAPLGGKSGGTIAFKKGQPEIANEQSIFFLSNEEKERLQTRSGTPYRDPDFNNTSQQIVECRHLEIERK